MREITAAIVTLSQVEPDTLRLTLSGDWLLRNDLPDTEEFALTLRDRSELSRLKFDCKAMDSWDTGVLIFLSQVFTLAMVLLLQQKRWLQKT